MRKTKIVCTLGPATDKDNVLEELIKNGLNVARCNFSHGSHEEHLGRMNKVKELREKCNKPVAILLDTKGPEIRTGNFENGKVHVFSGQTFTLVGGEKIIGDENRVNITYPDLYKDVEPGSVILIDDGLIKMEVEKIVGQDVVCKVKNDGKISDKKGVNVPDIHINMEYLSEQDKKDIIFGIEQDVDYIAASFVRCAEDVEQIRAILKENGGENIHIIAKIENSEGILNIDSIIEAADGIMVARGDMGVELPEEEVPIIQKMIIKKVYEAGKQVITATQMLDSMIRNPRPTRAEVTDVANAIYDGTDVVMLSGETANGKYPLEALKMMVKIAETTEQDLPKKYADYAKLHTKRGVSSAVTNATVQTAENLNAKAIVCPTISGFTARLASKLKPDTQIVGCSPYDSVLRKMQIYWGVKPVKTAIETSTDKIIEHALVTAENAGYIGEGDVVIVSAGIATNSSPTSKRGLTNTMRVVTI